MEGQTDSTNINIKSRNDLSEDSRLTNIAGPHARLEFVSHMTEMPEWQRFRLTQSSQTNLAEVIEQLQAIPGVEEVHVDQPKQRSKR
ncbi:hypothetical protein INT43_000615 [Umbelopsis isabellina]|uniref:Uncharacterized protein n=1 Tax=Mortierella isabellina TaxID=91625 RepID=A0A8H7UK48_MORIS|nr:hypothetical protein INT43_000615 [Umbelopsis isabellina]